jgi:hypothetical protein
LLSASKSSMTVLMIIIAGGCTNRCFKAQKVSTGLLRVNKKANVL